MTSRYRVVACAWSVSSACGLTSPRKTSEPSASHAPKSYALDGSAMAISPIVIVYVVGGLTGAEFDSFSHWLASAALCLVVAIPFSLYGLAFALLFRSETAVSAASGFLVIFAF